MNIREILAAREFSKELALRIVDWVGTDPDRMDELMKIFFSENTRTTQHAAYPLMFISDHNPQLFTPYLESMVDNMTDEKPDAVIRNSLRLFQHIDIPESIEGKMFDKCINYLESPRYPVGIRVFAMTILTNLCIKYPELEAEVLPLIEDILEISESAGMHSRGKKMLRILRKL